MIAEAGHYALILALALAAVQSTVPLWGARRGDARLMAVGEGTALGQLLFVSFAFAALTAAYVTSDFSLLNVVENSHSAKPLIYKVSGVWGNHEGSMLLWVLILVLFGAAVAAFGRNLPLTLRANVLAVQGWIAGAFLIFMLAASNPFTRLDPAPVQGRDLNPLLQDIGLAVHPPLLYAGYVGFSIAFAFAIAALIEGRIDAAWARWVRPWTLAAWIFLTLGIAMGSYWAYYELGWGGFWFWDPVENASLLPWLAGTALLHSALVMEKREALKVWTVLLALLTFACSLLGTFLVRSGVLTSVHAFAVDPTRGLFILVILAIFVGGSLSLFALRAGKLRQGGIFAPVSREGALVLNNLLLSTATATVLVGTLYPLALEGVTGEKISVGAPFFNATFGPLALALLCAVPFGPLLAWKRGDLFWAVQRLWAAAGVAVLGGACAALFMTGGPVLAPLGVALAFFIIVGSFAELTERTRLFRQPLSHSFRRATGVPSAVWGGALAHAGLGLCLLGVVGATAWNEERIQTLRSGEMIEFGGRDLVLENVGERMGSNYRDIVGSFAVRRGGTVEKRVESSKRFYTARQMTTTEAGLLTYGFSQLYVSLGELGENGTVAVRAEWKPLVLLIWLGPVLMALGGVLSIADRRLRIGVPRPARARRVAPVPAE
ncbi:heme lyase CcmF/NrfE family subunit [Terrihabitans rhizophilus]|uniref:Heme lyase CcmF/NrfE family subunit n=1 Tax=Terrihabitans rhizophilus TaxID=3092662 RepID=A0ABU4RSF4_9HYPH|nr:heme lyase CcmF/NrfE family subunit [Terrihabitans sp. PJ23]MDX6806580.1 heme lyase CcmF/NrfE family subunit [Terrihabitans sp. PJ23]